MADPRRVIHRGRGGPCPESVYLQGGGVIHRYGERLLKRNFQPGFRIELHQTDLGLALANAKELGMALPNSATCHELFNACAAHGVSKSDHSALVHAVELLANHEIG